MRRLHACVMLLSLVISCDNGNGDASEPGADTTDALQDVLAGDDTAADLIPEEDSVPPEDIAADLPPLPTVYGPPELWSEPIFDYIQKVVTGRELQLTDFDHSLKELAVFDGRLYIGYGDWTVNTGPVDIRHFEPDGTLTVDVTIDEESIDYYRIFGDRMFIPGVDPRQPPGADPLTGNVCSMESGGDWVVAFELEQCLHVLDVVPWEDTLFACGSGNIDMDHYHAGDDMAVIWRSDDGGLTWDLETTYHDDNTDAVVRWERFLTLGDDFVVFGQSIDYVQGVLTNVPRLYDGGAWSTVELLPNLWVRHSLQWTEDEGIVWGPDLGVEGKPFRVFRVTAGPAAAPVAYLDAEDLLVLDVFRVDLEDMIFLTRVGASTEVPAEAPYDYRILRTTDLEAFEEIASFAHDESFLSVALWQDRIYLGGWEGGLWESLPLQ
jgi:hypothetical protein